MQEEQEKDCICKGNWRLIIAETQHLFDRQFKEDRTGKIYSFVGVMHASDDYYYSMIGADDGVVQLLSCVGSIEGFGFTLIEENNEQS